MTEDYSHIRTDMQSQTFMDLMTGLKGGQETVVNTSEEKDKRVKEMNVTGL